MNDSNLAITSRNENFWEQRKLGEIGKIQSCKRIYRNQTSSKGEIPFYKIGTFGKEADSFISRKLYEEYKEKFSFPQIGDILISASGTLGRTVVYNGENAYFQDSNIVWIDNDNHLALNKYLEIYYQRIHWKASEGSTIKRLYNSDIERTIISIPKRDEQAELSKCLKLLNKVITLYDRKLKLLSQVKKYFLDNLFAEKEYPNLRFKGFTDAWEHRKLNSIFETVSKKGFPNLPVLTATQTKGMIYRNNSGIDIKFNENSLKNYKLVEPNQFVVHLRSFQGGLAASSLRGIASPAYTVLRFKDSKQGVNFWKEFFRSKKFINSLVKVTYGIRDGRTIKVTDLLDLKYRIPSQNLEQCKIGQLINSINKLLTLYENKQQHLTEIKKTLLNTMFI